MHEKKNYELIRLATVLEKQAAGLQELMELQTLIRIISQAAKHLGYILNAISRFGRWVVGPVISKITEMFRAMMNKVKRGRPVTERDVNQLAKEIMKLPREDRERLIRLLKQAQRA